MRLDDPSGRNALERIALDCFSKTIRKIDGATADLLQISECESTSELDTFDKCNIYLETRAQPITAR